MEEKNNIIISKFTIIIGILLAVTLVFSGMFWRDMKILNNAYSDMNQIEFISSSTQRLISIARTEPYLQKDVFFIGESTVKSLKPNTADSISVLGDVSIVMLANEVVETWEQIEFILAEGESNNINLAESIDLGLLRDAHFKSMTNLSKAINDLTVDLNRKISLYQVAVSLLIFAIALVMLNNILRTHSELKNSRKTAAQAQIDSATGLYNRSRCQELFKNNNTSNKKCPAILVFDLNDLKKVNDSLGHRAGDELIQSFAKVLKDACTVHRIPPFIGRYGGDEFIVYYDDVLGESEIKTYLKEVVFLKDNFNDAETRFQLSYAVGYSYVGDDSNEKLTTRQLFDKADEAMYENKIAGKREKNPNYDEEVAKGVVR